MSQAADYQALCGDQDCTIRISPERIQTPSGEIPAHRVITWIRGGSQSFDRGNAGSGTAIGVAGGATAGAIATCWTIILCPLGIIGGGAAGGMAGHKLGYSTDYQFVIIGYDLNGKKIVQEFYFQNMKSVNRMIWELPAITGLGMGEIRSIQEIYKSEGKKMSKTQALTLSQKKAIFSLLPDQIQPN
jgi:hypothetical protein